MLVTSKITIDLTRKEFKQYLYATQDDSNTRAVEITLLANKESWNIPEGTVGAVSCKKPDKTSCFYDTLPDGVTKAVTFEGNKVTAILAPQTLSAAGDVDVSIALFDSALNRLGTFPCIIRVEKNPSTGQDISNDYYNFKTLESISESIGDMNVLKTKSKENLVAAINELVDAGGVESVRFDVEQTLTDEEKARARENIDAASVDVLTISVSPNLSQQSSASTTAGSYLNTSCGWFGEVKAGETYTFSADFHKPADSGAKNIGVRVYSAKSGGTKLQEKTLSYSSVPVGSTKRLSGTFTATGDGYVSMNGAFNNLADVFKSFEIATNIQLEAGEVATEYKPYGERIVADGEFVANLAERVEKVEEAIADEIKTGSYTSHVLSIAHQGASVYGYPQNTVENIIACAKDGWKYAEFDVRWTSDGVPVISHDDERTLYGSTETITISTSTYEDLTAIQLFADANVKISTFYDVIDACKLYGLFACIEFKVWPKGTQLDDMVTYLKRRNMLRNCMWLSFNFDPLRYVIKRDADATVMLSVSSMPDTWLEDEDTRISEIVRDSGETILAFNKNILTSVSDLDTYLNTFRDRGFKIGIWTLDAVDLIKTYALYADYITSNVYKVEDALNA